MLSSRLRILALPHMLIRVDRETADVDVDAVPAETLVRAQGGIVLESTGCHRSPNPLPGWRVSGRIPRKAGRDVVFMSSSLHLWLSIPVKALF